jgi:LPXTG-motif cell wall-anchored protein
MSTAMSRMILAAALVGVTGVASLAQTTTATETKTFEVLAVDGNQLVVRLPEGTRELTVADDFRFTVNGRSLSVSELKPGMNGSATITTHTTVTPVTVTEVKNGTVVQRSGSTILVRTGNEVKKFTQGDLEKRNMTILRDGKAADVSDFREGDRLTATIITTKPPQVLTQKEVQATLAASKAPEAAPPPPRPAPPSDPVTPATAPAPEAPAAPTTLPKTASSQPLIALAGVLSLALAMVLRRSRVGR